MCPQQCWRSQMMSKNANQEVRENERDKQKGKQQKKLITQARQAAQNS